MLVEFHTTNGFPKELDLFVTGTVLQVSMSKKLHTFLQLITVDHLTLVHLLWVRMAPGLNRKYHENFVSDKF